LWAPALVGISLISTAVAGFHADAVVQYDTGSGSTPGYDDPTTALGSPSVQTVDPDPVFGGTFPVDPFGPPYLANQIVSIGEGGSLTVQFNTPILNNAANLFGIDFIIFGNSGFVITNGDFTGSGITDGSLFSANDGTTRVSVSADNVTYHQLNPSFAPTVDGLFPTHGSGNFDVPVDPSLTGNDFAGLGLTGIRSLYGGSGGGAGFDLSWAVDEFDQPVSLDSVSYVRVEVLTGVSEIDGFSVVPEPSSWALLGAGVLIFGAATFRRRRSNL
jgi:hypothetical protein